ncbi:MAG: hypothetical protein AB1384_12400 [Actinomycetota bacterium]
MSLYRFFKIKVGETWYDLSDVEREYDEEVLVIGRSSRSLSGKLQVKERARKKRFTFRWGYLHRTTTEDAGVGSDQLRTWAGTTQTYTLRMYTAEAAYTDYEVNLERAGRRLVRDLNGRAYWAFEAVFEEI